VVLKLKLARRVGPGPRGYPQLTRRTTLDEPTDDGAVIAAEAQRLLAREKLEQPVRLLGVGATNLASAAASQLALFGPDPERQRRSQLNRALDQITDRFGPKAVTRAGSAEVSRAGLSFQIKRGDDE
jgi:DNA polymerase-4